MTLFKKQLLLSWVSLSLGVLQNAKANIIDVKPETFHKYLSQADDKKLSMNQRWAALMQATDLARGSDLLEIKKFSQHAEWYLRNASLVALNKVNRDEALTEAKKLIADKSLVVRSAAVEIIAQRMSDENKSILKNEFDKAYNFHKKHSLWIRAQILEKIAERPELSDRYFFAKSVFDKDQQISKMSARALEKITGEKLANKSFVENWRKFVKANNWYE